MIFQFRKPCVQDGMAIHDLVERCSPLDQNSAYCNLLQSSYFADTAIVAELEGEIAGFITGFLAPEKRDTLFVWQVAVGPAARGMGLASRMLANLVNRLKTQGVVFVETTITEDNKASWALFERFASSQSASLESAPHFEQDAHFGGNHATEFLVRIGPFSNSKRDIDTGVSEVDRV